MDERDSRAKSYWRHRYAVMLSELAFSIIFLAVFQFAGISGFLKDAALSIHPNFYTALLIYLAVFGIVFYVVIFPLELYGGFILERKFSLSNQSLAAWLKDEAKKAAVSSVIFLLLLEAFYAIANNVPAFWWLAAAAFWIAVSLVLARLFPVLILPLFYRYSPLSKESLRKRALDLAAKFHIKVLDVFEIDFSTKTKKANAAIIGWGRSKRIIMADNLVKEFTDEEAVAVLAHEMAHHKLKHVWKLLFMGALSTALFFFILSRISHGLVAAFGAAGISDMALFPAIYLLFLAYSTIAMPVENTISRKFERDADIMALKMTGDREPFISMMETLAEKNVSDKNPNRLIEFLLYSHPSIAKRIERARRMTL